MDALKRDLEARSASIAGPLDTVYLGGGTPSMVSPELVGAFLNTARREIGVEPGAELTIEAHPNTVSLHSLRGYRAAGVNRISIGVESMDPAVLERLGRSHSPEHVAQVVQWARAAGFGNLSLDLMYGLPGQDSRSWLRTLHAILRLGPDHISLYPLSIEGGTVFARREAHLGLPGDEAVVDMYHLACRALGTAGYDHYEVANWALPGRRSRHNVAYWRGRPCAAVGVGAHGYLHSRRYVNVRSVKRYIEAVIDGRPPVASSEPIDSATELDEYLMLRLRLLTDGVEVEELRELYGDTVVTRVLGIAETLSPRTRVGGGRIVLTENAVPLANDVWSQFLGLSMQSASAPLHLVPA